MNDSYPPCTASVFDDNWCECCQSLLSEKLSKLHSKPMLLGTKSLNTGNKGPVTTSTLHSQYQSQSQKTLNIRPHLMTQRTPLTLNNNAPGNQNLHDTASNEIRAHNLASSGRPKSCVFPVFDCLSDQHGAVDDSFSGVYTRRARAQPPKPVFMIKGVLQNPLLSSWAYGNIATSSAPLRRADISSPGDVCSPNDSGEQWLERVQVITKEDHKYHIIYAKQLINQIIDDISSRSSDTNAVPPPSAIDGVIQSTQQINKAATYKEQDRLDPNVKVLTSPQKPQQEGNHTVLQEQQQQSSGEAKGMDMAHNQLMVPNGERERFPSGNTSASDDAEFVEAQDNLEVDAVSMATKNKMMDSVLAPKQDVNYGDDEGFAAEGNNTLLAAEEYGHDSVSCTSVQSKSPINTGELLASGGAILLTSQTLSQANEVEDRARNVNSLQLLQPEQKQITLNSTNSSNAHTDDLLDSIHRTPNINHNTANVCDNDISALISDTDDTEISIATRAPSVSDPALSSSSSENTATAARSSQSESSVLKTTHGGMRENRGIGEPACIVDNVKSPPLPRGSGTYDLNAILGPSGDAVSPCLPAIKKDLIDGKILIEEPNDVLETNVFYDTDKANSGDQNSETNQESSLGEQTADTYSKQSPEMQCTISKHNDSSIPEKPPLSPPLPGAKGTYAIDFDKIDDSVNPFAIGGSKLAHSPPKGDQVNSVVSEKEQTAAVITSKPDQQNTKNGTMSAESTNPSDAKEHLEANMEDTAVNNTKVVNQPSTKKLTAAKKKKPEGGNSGIRAAIAARRKQMAAEAVIETETPDKNGSSCYNDNVDSAMAQPAVVYGVDNVLSAEPSDMNNVHSPAEGVSDMDTAMISCAGINNTESTIVPPDTVPCLDNLMGMETPQITKSSLPKRPADNSCPGSHDNNMESAGLLSGAALCDVDSHVTQKRGGNMQHVAFKNDTEDIPAPQPLPEDDSYPTQPGEEFGDDEFRDAAQVFNDPTAFDFLQKAGSTNNFQESALARQSLYVKFDPLVGTQTPPSAQAQRALMKTLSKEAADESALLMFDTPPTVVKSSKPATLNSLLPETDEPQIGPLDETPKKNIFSPAKQETDAVIDGSNAVPDHRTTDPSSTSDDIVAVLKYSQHDWDEFVTQKDLEWQAKLLNRDREWDAKLKELTKLNEELTQKNGSQLAEINSQIESYQQSNEEMRNVVSQYEKTISQLISDKESEKTSSKQSVTELVKEKNQALEDLQSVETAFSDLHRRYEKAKQLIDSLRKNENELKTCVEELNDKLGKQEKKYQALKNNAEEKVESANVEIDNVRKGTEAELAALRASVKRMELKVASLERQLDQKAKENQELAQICDDLIAKCGSA